MILVVVVGLTAFPVKIETDFDSFLKADVESSMLRDGFYDARRAVLAKGRRLQGTLAAPLTSVSSNVANGTEGEVKASGPNNVTTPRSYKNIDLGLAYELRDRTYKNGVFHPQVVAAVAAFEERLRNLPGWQAFCSEVESSQAYLCEQGLSYSRYLMPVASSFQQGSNVPSELETSAAGRETIPLGAALQAIFSEGMQGVFLPKDDAEDLDELLQSTKSAKVLTVASFFRFRLPASSGLDGRWKAFLVSELVPLLRTDAGRVVGEGDERMLRVHFEGTGITDFEVEEALVHDLGFAAGSASFVFAYMVFHVQSVLLSFLGLAICVLSVPLAFVILALIAGNSTVSIASFLALFLVVGFGCDIIFVYTDAWRDSERFAEGDRARLLWTYSRASRVSLATTATTAVSFFANLASTIRALRQFGCFMGLCVVLAWASLTAIYTPLCLWDERLWARYCAPLKRGMIHRLESVGACKSLAGLRRYIPFGGGHAVDQPAVGVRARCFARWADFILRWRLSWACVTFVATVVAGIVAMQTVRQATSLPSIFPAGHNAASAPMIFEKFEDASSVVRKTKPPGGRLSVCSVWADDGVVDGRATAQDGSECDIWWCEATKTGNGESQNCPCFQRSLGACATGPGQVVTKRYAMMVLSEGDEQRMREEALRGLLRRATASGGAGLRFEGDQTSLLMEEWASGATFLGTLTRTVARPTSSPSNFSALCPSQEVCFCAGGQACLPRHDEWTPTQSAADPRAVAAGRRLAAPNIPVADRVKVRLVVGLAVDTSMPLLGGDYNVKWQFNDAFVPQNPWAQRRMLKLCNDAGELELRVDRRWCWHISFRLFLRSEGEDFPATAPRFDSLMAAFHKSKPYWKSFLWLSEDGKMQGLYSTIRVSVNGNGPSDRILENKDLWQNYVRKWNEVSAGDVGSHAFQVSSSWVEPEVQAELARTTVLTVGLLVALAFCVVIIFTRSFVLSCMVVACTLSVLVGLAFFVVVIMDWAIGLIEVVAMIYFVGYAVTYSLHVCHVYAYHDVEASSVLSAHPPTLRRRRWLESKEFRRYLRVSFALQRIGGAALGSAATTAGSAAFLTLCTLTIFGKLGGMCFAVTVLSIFTALVPLPAALLFVGPTKPGQLGGKLSLVLGRCRKAIPAKAVPQPALEAIRE